MVVRSYLRPNGSQNGARVGLVALIIYIAHSKCIALGVNVADIEIHQLIAQFSVEVPRMPCRCIISRSGAHLKGSPLRSTQAQCLGTRVIVDRPQSRVYLTLHSFKLRLVNLVIQGLFTRFRNAFQCNDAYREPALPVNLQPGRLRRIQSRPT